MTGAIRRRPDLRYYSDHWPDENWPKEAARMAGLGLT